MKQTPLVMVLAGNLFIVRNMGFCQVLRARVSVSEFSFAYVVVSDSFLRVACQNCIC